MVIVQWGKEEEEMSSELLRADLGREKERTENENLKKEKKNQVNKFRSSLVLFILFFASLVHGILIYLQDQVFINDLWKLTRI